MGSSGVCNHLHPEPAHHLADPGAGQQVYQEGGKPARLSAAAGGL